MRATIVAMATEPRGQSAITSLNWSIVSSANATAS